MICKTSGLNRMHIRSVVFVATLLIGTIFGLQDSFTPAVAYSQRVLVVVNDQPITNRDLDQRLKLNNALAKAGASVEQRRKMSLDTLINETIARTEARKRGVKIEASQVKSAIERMAQDAGTTVTKLERKLKNKGVKMTTLHSQVEATLYLQWVVRSSHESKITVADADVDRQLGTLKQDPRFKPVLVYQVREIDLPVEDQNEPLLHARAVEAMLIAKKYSNCKSLRTATKGVFNVKISPVVHAPATKMPQQIKTALEKAGTTKLIGPIRVRTGVRMIAFCGKRTLQPELPSWETVKRKMLRRKFEKIKRTEILLLRRKALIDFKDKQASALQ